MGKRKGTDGDDTLNGKGGDDRLFGYGGNDTLLGGLGDDVLLPGTGSDTLLGDRGNDTAIITDLDYTTPDTFDGGDGVDTLDLRGVKPLTSYDSTYWGFDSQTSLFTVGRFNDPFSASKALTFTNVEHLIGTNFRDLIVVPFATTNMTIDAGAGNDLVRAGDGAVTVYGGLGDDQIDFGYGRIAYYGEAGDDVISVATASRGLADGGAGIDTISSGGDVNLEAGFATSIGGGRFSIDDFENISLLTAVDGAVARGDDNANAMEAGYSSSDLVFFGQGGNDTIVGGSGADRISGGSDNDVLDGASGADTLTGGLGSDVFRFTDDFFSRPVETDTITDFKRFQDDYIDVSGIDADPNTLGDQTLRYLGTAAFNGRVGELRYEVRGADTFIQVDRDGNATADFEIRLLGAFDLRRNDFILSAADLGAAPDHPAVVSPEFALG